MVAHLRKIAYSRIHPTRTGKFHIVARPGVVGGWGWGLMYSVLWDQRCNWIL